ncbi:MAG: T9SS type A sorting domain-containing protein [Dysgonomonas sp.]
MKTFLSGLILLMAFGVSQNCHADGYDNFGASYSYGVYRFNVKNCLQNVYVNSTKFEIHAVVASDFNYDDPQCAVFQLYAAGGFEEVAGSPIPTNFSVQGQEVKVKKTSTGEIYTWKVYVRKAIKASLPFSRNFTSLLPVTGYDPTNTNSIGWAYRVVSTSTTPSAPILGGQDQAMFFAYDAPASSFSCMLYASNNNDQTNVKATIDGSSDGITWTNIKSYSNDLPKNNATDEEKTVQVALDKDYRYVRVIMTENKSGSTDPNISVNKFSVTSNIGTSISSDSEDASEIYLKDNKLVLDNLDASVFSIFNMSGRIVKKSAVQSNEITLDGLNNGIYVVAVTLTNGKTIHKKIVL